MLNYKTIAHNPDNGWVVMIHGAGGNIEVWFKQVAEFSRQFNLLLVDLAGHGESNSKEVFTKGFNFDKAADQVMEVCDHLNIESAHFMGLSLGSIIAQSIAVRYPQRVKAMVLAGAITHLSLRIRASFEFVDMFKSIMPYSLVKTLLLNAIIPQQKYNVSRSTFMHSAEKVTYDGFLQWIRLPTTMENYLSKLFLTEIATPTLYIMGEEDLLSLNHVKKLVRNSNENVSLAIIKDAGHVCNIDQKERFNRVSLEFIKSYN
jgi:pimeloyl-ACP methyl ester carboxylesterase